MRLERERAGLYMEVCERNTKYVLGGVYIVVNGNQPYSPLPNLV